MERFTEYFKDKALNLEHRNLFIFILVENILYDQNKETENNVVVWVDQPVTLFKLQPNSLKSLKNGTCLTNLAFTRTEMQL